MADWRKDIMQVTSGPMGKEIIHFEAPVPDVVYQEMQDFLKWLNSPAEIDPVLKAAIGHFWFVTIHPFDDGNGRIARADQSRQRFYSMSAQIQKERNEYYDILESTQKGDLDITPWLDWFLNCLYRSMVSTDLTIEKILERGQFWESHRDKNFNIRQQKMLQALLDSFFGNLNVSKWAKITKTSTDTALRDIKDLIEKGILIQEGAGRNTSYKLKNHNS